MVNGVAPWGKFGQWRGPVQHVHRIGKWGGLIGQRGKWWTEGNRTPYKMRGLLARRGSSLAFAGKTDDYEGLCQK